MAMNERVAIEASQSYEVRRMQVLDGSAAIKRANARRARVARMVVSAAAVVVVLFSLVFVETKISAADKAINAINGEIVELQNQSAQQDLTIGALSSNARIESYASTYLNMVYPAAEAVYYLNENSSKAIADGYAQLARAEEAETAEESSTLWEAIDSFLRNFFTAPIVSARAE